MSAKAEQADISTPEQRTQHSTRAAVMFAVALAFLMLFALMIPHDGQSGKVNKIFSHSPWYVAVFLSLWAVIIIEAISGWYIAPDRGGKARGRLALVALVPAFRMTISPLRPNTDVWLPKLGWLKTGAASVTEMEERTAFPMLIITALILPIIIADFTMKPSAHQQLEEKFEQVARFDLSTNRDRLYLLDENQAVLANFVQADGEAETDVIDSLWIAPGTAKGKDETALKLWPDMRFSFRTGCAITQGMFESTDTALHFSGIEKTSICPPTMLEWTIYLTKALIWISFALEFVLLVSLADKKLAFCKKHWINIIIILLPLLAFLRSLQIFRFLRMAKAGKLIRAYRLKGLAVRVTKLALLFNLVERMLSRNPEKYSAHLDEKIAETEAELEGLRTRRAELETANTP